MSVSRSAILSGRPSHKQFWANSRGHWEAFFFVRDPKIFFRTKLTKYQLGIGTRPAGILSSSPFLMPWRLDERKKMRTFFCSRFLYSNRRHSCRGPFFLQFFPSLFLSGGLSEQFHVLPLPHCPRLANDDDAHWESLLLLTISLWFIEQVVSLYGWCLTDGTARRNIFRWCHERGRKKNKFGCKFRLFTTALKQEGKRERERERERKRDEQFLGEKK